MPFCGKNVQSGDSEYVTCTFSAASAPSRAQVVGGSIAGTITDSAGAVLPGTPVMIRNEETGSERRLVTNGDGTYNAPSVPVGRYTVSAERGSFATQQRTGVVAAEIGRRAGHRQFIRDGICWIQKAVCSP